MKKPSRAVAAGPLIWFVVWLVRRGGGGGYETPEETLRRRYARGEIDRETFERVMEDLRGVGRR